jgi:protein-disulfide isomerase-like protein with CxxC motif
MIYLTASDFFRSQSMGVSGFPTTVLKEGENLSLLSSGFMPFEDLKPRLDKWIAGELDAQAEDKNKTAKA